MRRFLPEALLLMGFFSFLLFITRGGIYPSSDSDTFLRAALTLRQGMLTAQGTPMIWFPPLYPVVLAALGDQVRLLHALLYGCNAMIFALLLSEAGFHRRAAVGLAAAISISPGMVFVHSRIYTEPLFITLTLLALLSMARGKFTAAAVFIALSCLQRYPGIVMGGVLVYAMALENAGNAGGRAAAARAVDDPERAADRQPGQASRLASAGGGSRHKFVNYLWLVVWPDSAAGRLVHCAAVYSALYLAFLIVSITLFDWATPLDMRILGPVLLTGWLAARPLIVRAWTADRVGTLLFIGPALLMHVGFGLAWTAQL